ncbi:MAG: hypothetical protein KBD01_18680, partial [Acidobacteria bacterium]|nr:hypothetical protein [Acidobacteriota bacterium]
MTDAHVLFLPDRDAPRMFAWGPGYTEALPGTRSREETARVIDETLAARDVPGVSVPLLAALPALAALTAEEAARAPASLAAWSLAAKLALELVGRERIVPRVVATDA